MDYCFDTKKIRKNIIKKVVSGVSDSLEVKGYNVKSQIAGYLISGDPCYITPYNDARNTIIQLDRYDILEEIISDYLERISDKKSA